MEYSGDGQHMELYCSVGITFFARRIEIERLGEMVHFRSRALSLNRQPADAVSRASQPTGEMAELPQHCRH